MFIAKSTGMLLFTTRLCFVLFIYESAYVGWLSYPCPTRTRRLTVAQAYVNRLSAFVMAGVFNTDPWYQLENNVIETKAKKKKKNQPPPKYGKTIDLCCMADGFSIQSHDFVLTVNELIVNWK